MYYYLYMRNVIQLNSKEWTRLSDPGQSGSAIHLVDNNIVLFDHSSNISTNTVALDTTELSEEAAHPIRKTELNETVSLIADNVDDVFYALSPEGDTKIRVDMS